MYVIFFTRPLDRPTGTDIYTTRAYMLIIPSVLSGVTFFSLLMRFFLPQTLNYNNIVRMLHRLVRLMITITP